MSEFCTSWVIPKFNINLNMKDIQMKYNQEDEAKFVEGLR